MAGGGSSTETTTALSSGIWYHASLTWDGINLRMYVNGNNGWLNGDVSYIPSDIPIGNRSPEIIITTLQDAIEDNAYANTVVASDPDVDDVLVYHLFEGPAWLSIDTTNDVLSGTPENADVGTNISIQVRAADGNGGFDTLLTTIDVLNVNDAPVVVEIAPIVFDEDDSIKIDLDTLVTDVDNDTSEINWDVPIPVEDFKNLAQTMNETKDT